MRNRYLYFLPLLACLIISCGIEEALKQEYLNEGVWRGVIKTQGQEIPFNFEVIREDSVTYDVNIINGQEQVNIKGLAMQGDSVFIPMHLYDAGIKARLVGNKLIGVYEKYYQENSSLPFEAVHKQTFRFPQKGKPLKNIEGKWDVTFKEQDETINAVGIFKQEGSKVEGTFVTSLGDYRFLEGIVDEDILWLSTFDGENAFLFKADIKSPNEMKGHFWSGAFQYQSWHAIKNEHAAVAEIPTEDLVKEGNKTFLFNLIDLNGKMISSNDPRFVDKVKVIHMFGTWNPNSIDQVRFLSEWQKENKNNNVVILGFAFEQDDSFNYAKARINKMAKRLNVPYNFLIAGAADTSVVVEKFPALKSFKTFPTTLILDQKNQITKIKSGFFSPASGHYHFKYIKEFNDAINDLLFQKEEGIGKLVSGN